MLKAAARGNVHHLFAKGSLQQVATRAIEANVMENRLRNCRCRVRAETPATSANSEMRH